MGRLNIVDLIDAPSPWDGVVGIIGFLPFILVVLFRWRSQRGALHRGMIRNELIALAITYGSLIGTLLLLYALYYTGWTERNESPDQRHWPLMLRRGQQLKPAALAT